MIWHCDLLLDLYTLAHHTLLVIDNQHWKGNILHLGTSTNTKTHSVHVFSVYEHMYRCLCDVLEYNLDMCLNLSLRVHITICCHQAGEPCGYFTSNLWGLAYVSSFRCHVTSGYDTPALHLMYVYLPLYHPYLNPYVDSNIDPMHFHQCGRCKSKSS